MKIIGLSGAQGAGKSTLLTELVVRGWKVDTFRVSRAVQAQLGWDTLDRVMESPETMIEFQTEVFNQKYKHDLSLRNQSTDDVILTERTFADIVAYTAQWAWRFVDQGKMELSTAAEFVTSFTARCVHAQYEIYTGTILLPYMEHVIWEDDANRAKRSDVDSVFADIERFLRWRVDSCRPIAPRCMKICGKTVHERADEVQTFLRTL